MSEPESGSGGAMRLSTCEAITEYLARAGVPYFAGVPGHGILPFVEALRERSERIKTIMVRHEQSAAHLADGYFRVAGDPLGVFTSVGPGAINTLTGVATAMADSSALLVFTGQVQTYMWERGGLQAIYERGWADAPSMFRPVVKRSWQISHGKQILDVIHRAYTTAVTGRPGPVHIDLPMDVQAQVFDGELPDPSRYVLHHRQYPDPEATARATELLAKAERPVILAGGGVIISGASEHLVQLAEHLGAPVITTVNGKGAIPEDHPLAAYYAGSKATTVGNALARDADVILALGCRFAEWSSSSYRPGDTFSIPPTKLIHVDLDPKEVGKNYPLELGIVADARSFLEQTLVRLQKMASKARYQDTPYFQRISELKAEWNSRLAPARESGETPMTTSRFLAELRAFLDRDAIVVGAAGHAQAQLFQEFPVYFPRTHISSGSFSTMGFCVPATIGAKLAKPEAQVVGVCGDGDFQMTGQEIATAVQHGIPVVYTVLNNYGWISIRDLQVHLFGESRTYFTEFRDAGGDAYSPDFVKWAEAMGAYGQRVVDPADVGPALKRAFGEGRPAVIEVMTESKYPRSEGLSAGYSDFPVPG
jgi:acetolactate synthase-1/2/3 large subunit